MILTALLVNYFIGKTATEVVTGLRGLHLEQGLIIQMTTDLEIGVIDVLQ